MMRILALVLAALVAPAIMAPASAQDDAQPSSEASMPDFSEVTSKRALQALADKGELVPVYLFPPSLGGPEFEANQVYVTPAAAQAKATIDGTIERMVGEGLLDQMDVKPEYRGDSLVPARIVIQAWSTEREGRFEPNIEVW